MTPAGTNRILPGDWTERELIKAIRSQSKPSRTGRNAMLRVGIGDDCAVLRPRAKEDLVVTTDFSLEKVHFRRDWHSPQSVGHRCLARGLSDLAAMGARPVAAFLSLALPARPRRGSPALGIWVQGFFDGFRALADRYGVTLAGGDTAQSPSTADGGLILADIVLVGSVPRGKALLRSTARAGDLLFVTGSLGGSAAELRELARRPAARRPGGSEAHPHLFPEPRLKAGRKLLRRGFATAAIDLSDGLSTDLAHLCEESGVAAEVYAESLPVDARATLHQALHGGEDYELLFTASPGTRVPSHLGGVLVHPIGRIKPLGKGPLVLLHQDGRAAVLPAAGWEHFRSGKGKRAVKPAGK